MSLPPEPNPKQAFGDLKVPLAFVPPSAIIAMALAFGEGARKYGAYNWRDKAVETMTYGHAALRHILAWIDGEDIDPESGKRHTALAMACLGIIEDVTAVGNAIDNRPTKGTAGEMLRDHMKKPDAVSPNPYQGPIYGEPKACPNKPLQASVAGGYEAAHG